jgi:hypothetical protein
MPALADDFSTVLCSFAVGATQIRPFSVMQLHAAFLQFFESDIEPPHHRQYAWALRSCDATLPKFGLTEN